MTAAAGGMPQHLGAGMQTHARPSAFVDDTQVGSGWRQLGVGVLGLVLALLLVIGQISVATTAGISRNLKINVAQLRQANGTMASIVERAGPSVQMERAVAEQAKYLANTNKTMISLNAEMARVSKTSAGMEKTVARMQKTSGSLATGVGAMNTDTGTINKLLGPLPSKATATHGHLSQIDTDSGALNTELAAIAGKMAGYGLPPAKNVKAKRR